MTQRSFTIVAVALGATLALSACNTADQSAETDAANNMAAAEVAPPPMIVKTTPYRCHDGSTIRVDFFNDNKSLNIRTEKNETGFRLTTETPGDEATYEGQGYVFTPHGTEADLTTPDAPKQVCKS